MALDATINLLEEQNSVLGDIQNLLRKDQETQSRKRLEEKENTDEQTQLFRDLLNAVKGAAGVRQGVDFGVGGAGDGAPSTGFLDGIGDKFTSIFTAISAGFLAVTKIFEKIKKFISARGGIRKIAGRLLKFFGKVFAVFAVFKGIYDGWKAYEETGSIKEALTTGIASIVDTLFGWIPKALGYILEFVGAPEWLTDALKNFDLGEATKGFLDGVVDVVSDAFKFIAGKLSFLGEKILKAFGFDVPSDDELDVAPEDRADPASRPTLPTEMRATTGEVFRTKDFFLGKARRDMTKKFRERGFTQEQIDTTMARKDAEIRKQAEAMYAQQLSANAASQQPIVINNNVDASNVSQNVQTNVGMATEAVEKTAPRRRSSFKATPYGL